LKILLPLLILAVAAAVAARLVATKPPPKPVEVKEKAWLVSAVEAQPGAFAPGLPLYGRVESLWSTQLTAGVAAEVAEVAVIEGDEVQQGDLLVRLDDRDTRLLLTQREAELREADARIAAEEASHAADLEALPREKSLLALTEAELGRTRDLVQKRAGSQSTFDTARQAVERQAISVSAREQAIVGHDARMAELQAQRTKAEALRDQAALELERTRISAPYTGRVARVLVAAGKRVRVGDALVELYDTGAMVVRALLPERYLAAVREATKAGVDLVAKGSAEGLAVSARLLRLAGEVDSGGVEGLFAIEEGGDFLQQGRFVGLDLTLPPQEGLLALPHEAIYGTERVYRVDEEGRLRPVRVERVGELREGGASRILVRAEELSPGARIVVTQLPNAVDGLLVRMAEGDNP